MDNYKELKLKLFSVC